MPASKRNGSDLSACKFRTLLTNLPAGIQHMLDRSLDSLGTDANVLARWSQPVQTEKGVQLEREFFPHNPTDICCADGAAFVLYQSGVCDIARNKLHFKPIGYGYHAAHYYWPHPGNQDICRLIQEIPNTMDPKDVDT